MQTTNTVLMIEPIAFGFNEQTAVNNYFQVQQEGNVQEKALQEFHSFVEKLRAKSINVITIKDTIEPKTPDSIFPNNWVSFHADGKIVLYPMFAENRRLERREDIINQIKEQFDVTEIIDYSKIENEDKYLEGTGSMIFDHDNKIAYGSVSLRLDEKLFRKFCADFGFTPVVFHSYQTAGEERLPIYHTNVMMCVADKFVVICLDCIDDETERQNVIDSIKNSGKELIEISEDQMQNFAGNMLQVQNENREKFLIMSQSAYKSLKPEQVSAIEKYSEIIYSDLETIETNGGGSARCMLAEVFLPKK
ncbi:citrulline utilization hydrolase CtlX [Chryseobacterium sp. FH1]|uniref:citrulline utilization hydrolase CtlX n=1 Tax=Chryseobacterium sp. FH1 TaxID=1233951 RepID=UPI0004E2A395|nr:arginine deiminase-related protein [Chryseobacterium sp. FH1]KFC23987.1 amidinotransferase [Chryseobacterium sp. FH1]